MHKHKDGQAEGDLTMCKRKSAPWRDAGIKESTFYRRIATGMSEDDAISQPVRRYDTSAEIDGVTKTLAEWARHGGLSQRTLRKRFDSGLRGGELIAPPPSRKPVKDGSS